MMAAETIALRPAEAGDSDLVLGWRNDPFIMARGSSQRSVGATEHRAWFAASIADRNRRLWIVNAGEDPAGLVRFDRVGLDAVVSVYLVERYCGRGLGVAAIRQGSRLALDAWPIERIIAYVRTDNDSARRAFVRAGFALEAIDSCPSGHVALVLRR
jgi:UDP-2,4-diacetamido-2,4,6-trideoxy-beta-L-altropyranose hydrolase